MNNLLDIRRIRLLFRNQWAWHRRLYMWEFLFVVIIVPLLISIGLKAYNDGRGVDMRGAVDSVTNVLMFLLGVFYARSMACGFFLDSSRRDKIRVLMLPATPAEKFVAALLFAIVVGTLVFLVAILVGWALMLGMLWLSDTTTYHGMMAVVLAGSPMQWPVVEGLVTIVVGGMLMLSLILFYTFAFAGSMKTRFYFYTLIIAEIGLFWLITHLAGSWASARAMNGVVALTLFGIQTVAAYRKFCQIQIN